MVKGSRIPLHHLDSRVPLPLVHPQLHHRGFRSLQRRVEGCLVVNHWGLALAFLEAMRRLEMLRRVRVVDYSEQKIRSHNRYLERSLMRGQSHLRLQVLICLERNMTRQRNLLLKACLGISQRRHQRAYLGRSRMIRKPAEISSSVSSKALDDWQESFSRLAGSKPPESLFGFGKKAEETPKPAATTDGLFGSKSPVSLNAQSTSSDDVSYPSLLAAPASNALATINGNSAQVTTNSVASLLVDLSVPPPPPHYTDEDKESYDRLYKIKALNSSLLRALQAADWSADWRGVLSVYSQIYEQITGPGTHKRKEPQAGNAQNVSSPKRSKQDDAPSKQAPGSAAAKLFGEIVDKNMGSSPTVGAALFGFGKPAEPKSTPEKPTTSQSAIFGNAFSTPPSNQEPKPSTPPSSSKSNLFSAGGGAAIDHGHGTSGGLFANLKPTINVQKDKGEEDDSPQKPGPGLGLFGDKSKGGDSSSIVPPSQPSFFFGAPNKTSTPEKPTGSTAGPFGSASKLGGDHTWKPDTPIKFGPPASGLFGSSASTSSAGGEAKSLFGTSATAPGFSFSSGSASSTSTATPNAANTPSFTFGAGTSAAQSAFKLAPPVSAPRSGLSTPGDASSDPDSAKPPPSDVTSSEPSDDVPTTKTDLSGLGPGEENDEVLFTVRVAVYSKDDKGAMKKIGVGASRVLKDKTSGKSRFLVRTEQGKVVVNVRLHKGVEYTCFAEKKVVMVPDFSGGGLRGGNRECIR
ncbi:hypothetical protein BDZ91DRAFT_410658 [Kalaharituber pfeilii]|nr:hypothetical protein BDZ91DRAFT_410658 [Kalaharituber pfeilii]